MGTDDDDSIVEEFAVGTISTYVCSRFVGIPAAVECVCYSIFIFLL
jgi:hypothetical protein